MPARKGDGTGLSFNGFSEVRKGDGTVLWTDIPDIPDSVVTRPLDNRSKKETPKYGIVIESTEEWPTIGGRISGNTRGLTKVYTQEMNNDDTLGTVLGSTDVSNLTAGDTFTIDLSAHIQPNTRYAFVGDAEGNSYTRGYRSENYPIASPDGNLEMVAEMSAGVAQNPGINANLFDKIGDVGFN